MDKKDGVDRCLCAEHKKDGSIGERAEALERASPRLGWGGNTGP